MRLVTEVPIKRKGEYEYEKVLSSVSVHRPTLYIDSFCRLS